MLRMIKEFIKRFFHRHKTSKSNQAETPGYAPPPVALESPSASQPSIGKAPDPPVLRDLWQSAYDRLDPREQHILSTISIPTQLGSSKIGNSPTAGIIDRVIQTTEEQYEKHRDRGLKIRRSTGEDIDLRRLSHKIINAALSFKTAIDAVVALDPTNHAASAWAVVSLGLTMSKNRTDLRDALFDSSEYLADVLARHACIESNFYHNTGNKLEIGQAIVKVYTAVFWYAAEVLDAQNSGDGRWMLESITGAGNQRLAELQASVKEEGLNLHQWVQLDQLLQHGQQAESILGKIDKMSDSLQSLIRDFNLPIAEGASYDSYMNQHDDLCLPETRVELRSQISEWPESADSKCIFWLNGMAGTGKSTIARTVARTFRKKGRLGASFFFKNGEADRGNAKRLIPTIAKQLMASNRQLAHGIFGAMESETDIASKSLRQQFDILLLQPLLNLELNEATPTVIVIDALDECEQEDDIKVILELLPRLQKSKSLRVKIFLTSRPELAIRLGFEQNNDHQDLVLHELPQTAVKRDILIFLKDRLKKIQKEHSLSPDWPGEDITEILVAKSVPLFIFAATICRFIGEKYQVPEDRLAAVLRDSASTSASQMERMYLPVLNKLLSETELSEEFVKELKGVLGVIILLAAPLSVSALARLVDTPEQRIRARLAAFYSVLHVPNSHDAPVRILHLSFREFLLNTTSVFRVDKKTSHRKIALYCLRIMNSGLKHNICGLTSYGTQRADIARSIVDQHLLAELQYSCRYWMYHLEGGGTLGSEVDIYGFLQEHFLHWLEAMSLMGLMPETVGIIGALQSRMRSDMSPELSRFLDDTKQFILKNIYIANIAPLQLYCSGLAFSPKCSTIREVFEADQRWIHIPPQGSSWRAEIQTLDGHSGWVLSVVFSPDGQMVASGSQDRTIKLWDTRTGEEVRTLKGHSNTVWSVAFSPNGQIVASGSHDRTIKLWDARTGEEVCTLEGHSNTVWSVAFSPDGQMVASGSGDRTIKLWDARTGEEVRTLEGHSSLVSSVAFSPDGQIVASGSHDRTIKLWDARSGKEVRTLKGHSDWVWSVAFSPDGQIVASGSDDRTIKLWDTRTGEEVCTLEGHSNTVRSVAFSPDGQMVGPSYRISVENNWVVFAGEKVVWLPSNYRQFTCFVVKNNTLALGYGDGRVSILGFREPKG
ncbi:hypothetical protein BBP40_007724 [Aspergillus hancockii]|nr:hypothetical protein BBP40_007724 [Aspergillus hancockii]